MQNAAQALNDAKREMEKIKMDLELEKGEIIRESQAKEHQIKTLETKIQELNEKIQDQETTENYLKEIIRKREAEKKQMKKEMSAMQD